MPKHILIVLALLAVLGSVSLAQVAVPAGFLKSWDAAKAQAAKEGKPIYIHFTEARCGWCRIIENTVYTSDVGKKALEGFVAVSLDCSPGNPAAPANSALMTSYGGNGFPHLVITTPTGEQLFAEGGYRPAKQFARELNAAHAYYEFLKAGEKYDRTDYEQSAKALQVYSDMEMWTKAGPAADAVLKLDPDNAKGNNALAAYVQIGLITRQPAPMTAAALESLATKLKVHCDKIRKLDPDNAKGVLENALLMQALVAAQPAAKEQDSVKRNAALKNAIAVMDELTSKAKTLEQGQDIWFTLFNLHAMLGEFDDAVAAIDKAIAVDPESPIASQYKNFRQAALDEKARRASQTQPTTAPKSE